MSLPPPMVIACEFAERFFSGLVPPLSPKPPVTSGPLPVCGISAENAIKELAAFVSPRLVRSDSGRYFGFVIGGATPTSIAADWLTSVWDQNGQAYGSSAIASEVESVVARWMLELLALPSTCSMGFVTGAQMANFTALSIARNEVLSRAGWDFDKNGLFGAPPIAVFLSEESHATVRNALRMAGFGAQQLRLLPADSQGRMQLEALRGAISGHVGPKIVCAQAGNVNTGAFEEFETIATLASSAGAWLHVDGAFGLWARASNRFASLASGSERADSWSVDAHKWLNVPYDSGLVIVRDAGAHARFKTSGCAYAGTPDSTRRDGSAWVPENSRRARAFVLFSALRSFGVSGVADLVDRSCDMAQLFAKRIVEGSEYVVLNDVVLNQVLVRLAVPDGIDASAFHHQVANTIQQEGVCWIGTGLWRGEPTLRLSFSNWQTDELDVEAAVSAITNATQRVEKDLSSIFAERLVSANFTHSGDSTTLKQGARGDLSENYN